MASSNEKTERNLSESDSENEAADFPRFIFIESLEEVCLAKFFPFLREKAISFMVEVDSQRQAENIKN